MAYNTALAESVRKNLKKDAALVVEEKKMFGGLAFMVNCKMCKTGNSQDWKYFLKLPRY